MFKITSILTVLGLVVFTGAPAVFADSINVSNEGSATITNAVAVSASSGGNQSTGGAGDEGGNGGAATGSDQSGQSGGDGGTGGDGGAGGTISSGDAFAAAFIYNEANTTELRVEDNGTDENQYNETLDMHSQVGSSESSASLDLSVYNEETDNNNEQESSDSAENSQQESSQSSNESSSEENGVSSAWSASNESSNSSSSNSEENESSSSNSEESSIFSFDLNAQKSESENHDNLDLHYTRTYVGGQNSISVSNLQTANLNNAVAVSADTGGNHSQGGEGAEGGNGAGVTGSDQDGQSGGDGGDGGWGGNGDSVVSGDTESVADIVNISGKTVTRVVRN